MREHILPKSLFKDFFYAGKAEFTAHNEHTGNRVTFYVTKSNNKGYREDVYFVSCRVLGDHQNGKVFVGTIFNKTYFSHSKKSPLRSEHYAVRAVQWFIDNFKELENMEYFKIYHVGNCCKCGRKLTVPDSIASGFGPDCIKSIRTKHNFFNNNN